MEMETKFLYIKSIFVGTFTGFAMVFGWVGVLVLLWVLVMLADFATGCAKALKAGVWQSSKARTGIFGKVAMMFVVFIAGILDIVLTMMLLEYPIFDIQYSTALLPLVLVWYILTELGSILENAIEMGAPIPDFLANMLKTSIDLINNKGE